MGGETGQAPAFAAGPSLAPARPTFVDPTSIEFSNGYKTLRGDSMHILWYSKLIILSFSLTKVSVWSKTQKVFQRVVLGAYESSPKFESLRTHKPTENCETCAKQVKYIPEGMYRVMWTYVLRGARNARNEISAFQPAVDDCIKAVWRPPLRVTRRYGLIITVTDPSVSST